MASNGWFGRRSQFSQARASHGAASIPDGVATKCVKCGEIIFTSDFEKNLKVCAHCGFHHKLSADERIRFTVDEGSFAPLHENLRSVDPLRFPEYQAKLDKGVAATGMHDGIRVGVASVGGVPVVLAVADFSFMAASMGSVAGEKIVRALEEGAARRAPVVIFTASGGARMQEGLLSLMQMAKTSAAAARLAAANIPYVVVMTDATMAGVLASYASLGDITLAEPGALIGFAGARVSAQASTAKPPADYQTAEWQMAHGQIDQIVARKDLPDTISSLLTMLGFSPADELGVGSLLSTPTDPITSDMAIASPQETAAIG